MGKDALRDKVSVVGVGCCPFGENWDQSPSDMIVDAAYEAYADAGIDEPQKRIEAVFTGSLYTTQGPHECADSWTFCGDFTYCFFFEPRAFVFYIVFLIVFYSVSYSFL